MIRPEAIFLVLAAAIGGLLLMLNLVASDGHVLFTQDDPYIHLALAERLLTTGHYGINPGESAAPSSSILYPFLLVPLLFIGLGPAAALVLCVAATGVTIMLICALVREAGYPVDNLSRLALVVIAVGWLFGFNLLGVALTGMEHALQVMLALACLLGLLRLFRGGGPPWFLPVAAALLPLVRYEGVGIWLICVTALAWRRHWRAAALTLLPTLLALAGFSLFLVRHGLPPLPSSVLSKAGSGMLGARTAGGNVIAIFAYNVHANLSSAGSLPLMALVAANLVPLAWPRLRQAAGAVPIGFAGAAVCLAHVLAGKFGAFGRYEAYAEIFGTLTAMLVCAPACAKLLNRGSMAAVTGLAALPVILFGYVVSLQLRAPVAAANIYAQQYQLHRFAVRYWGRPVAINDLGEVSYDNPNYILDYAGLGSEAARLARAAAHDPDWMDSLARQHGIGLAMIFPSWFPQVPADWKLVARMHLHVSDIVAGDHTVAFYATNADAARDIAPALAPFAASLPRSADLEILP